jgi:hypothetical protein
MRKTPLPVLGFFSGALMACSSAGAPAVTADALHLEVEVETTADAPEDGPLIRIHITNAGSDWIAFTETFGFEYLYLRIALDRLPGETRIKYPSSSQYELFSTPRFECLRPGETKIVEIPLNSWYHVYGGELDLEQAVPEPGPYSFRLGPGSYRVRAIYSSPDQEVRRGCRGLLGLQKSEWVEFTLPE